MSYAPACWLAPEGVECSNPLTYRMTAMLASPKTPTKIIPFGVTCGPHLAGMSQGGILVRHFDVLACLTPYPKPDGLSCTFGFAAREPDHAAG